MLAMLMWVGVAHGAGSAHAPAPQEPAPSTQNQSSDADQPPPAQKPAAQKPSAAQPGTASESAEAKAPAEAQTGEAAASSGGNADGKTAADADALAADQGQSDGGKPSGAVRQSELYGDRLDGLEAEVDELKDKIFRSKARLTLLKETVLRGVLAGSRVILTHRNKMGSAFRLVKIVYILDGAQIYARRDDTGGLDQEDALVIFDGNLPPGPHTATVELTYKGHGFGVFSYLSGYTFDSRSSHTFTAPEDGAVKLTSVGFERGNMTTEMRDRPSVDWQTLPLDDMGKPLPRTGKRGK